jgi:hypothetical protein
MFRELLFLAIVLAASSEPCDNFSRLVKAFFAFSSVKASHMYLVTDISDLVHMVLPLKCWFLCLERYMFNFFT